MRFSSAFFWTVFSRELILVASLGNAVVLARVLGPAGVGTTSLVITIATLLSQAINLGFSGPSHFLTARNPADAGRLFTLSLLPMALLGGPLTAALLCFPAQADLLFGDLSAPYRVLALIGTGLLIVNQNLNALIFGLQWYRGNGALNAVAPVGILLGNLSLTVFGILTPERALQVWMGWNAVAALASMVLLFREHPPSCRITAALFKEALVIGVRVLSLTLLTLLAYRVMLILVDRELGRDAVGYYSLALSVASLLEHVPQVLGSLIVNRVSAKQMEAGEVARILRAHWILGAILAAFLELAGPFVLTAVFGERFVHSVPALRILAIGYYFTGAWSVTTGYLNGRYGCPPSVVVISGLTFALSLGLGLLLVGPRGLPGAALSWASAGVFSALAILGVFLRDGNGNVRLGELLPGRSDVAWLWNRGLQALRRPA